MQKTGIVVPCYNEVARLSVNDFLKFLRENPDYFICFVNDGSKDDTAAVLNELENTLHGQINVLNLEQNSGKAEAVRRGMEVLLGKNDISALGFLDADLSTPLSEFHKLKEQLKNNDKLQAVCGSRVRRMGAYV